MGVDELARRFGVSVDSIRKDLQQIVREGRCERYYGGARRVDAPVPAAERDASSPPAQGADRNARPPDKTHGKAGASAAPRLLHKPDQERESLHDELIGNLGSTHVVRHSWPWSDPAPTMEPVCARRDVDTIAHEARLAVARRAYLEIHDGDTVFLDVSRTNALLAELIAQGRKRLVVTTNMIEVMQRLSNQPDVTLMGTGGYLNVQLNGFVGSATVSMLEPLLFAKAFIGADGVDLTTSAVTSQSIEGGEVKERVIHNSSYPFLLAEEQKFCAHGNFRFASVSDFSAVITDTSDDDILDRLARSGVPTLRAA